jgi:ABC-type antimicrobial peptide transport system permease subunit
LAYGNTVSSVLIVQLLFLLPMLRNYIKIAFRNLLRHKAFSFINVFGLSIGMSCSILILLWVHDELSYDQFHADSDYIYRLTAELPQENLKAAVSSAPIAPAIQNAIPEVESTIRISMTGGLDFLQVGDRNFDETRMCFADSNFLQFFSFPLVKGDPATAMLLPEGVLITEAMAKKYFGTEDPIGKIIRKNRSEDLTVTGVLADIPRNSHLQFDFVQPMTYLARTNRDLKENIWDNFNYYTYIRLDKNAAATPPALAALGNKVQDIYKKHEPHLKVAFNLQPLHAVHLHSNFMADVAGHGNIQYVYIFIVVGIFVLAVACINFMNLATARSARRAKEVGLRKVAGAVRFQLIRQFLAESSLIACLALVIALAVVYAVLPVFNDLAGKTLSINLLNVKMVAGVLSITLVTGLLAGSYPALFLSGFVPVKVLKGNLKSGAGNSLFRNTMVIVQFSVSIMLLVGTAVIYNQLQYIRTRNLGFDKENLIYMRMTGELWGKYQALRTSLEQNSLTSNFTFVSDLPTNLVSGTVNVEWEGKDPESQPLFANMAIDENFMEVFNATLLSGRGFSKDFKADTSSYIVNEKALKVMNMDVATAVGQSLTQWGRKGTIIGVVKDFNFKPIQQPIEPLILRLNTWGAWGVIRTKPMETERTIAALESICKTLNPAYPFTYNFIDKDLDNMYQAEQRLSSLFTIFAVLAIFISCLGLYGLSAFLAERRTKEIGVRKVLGASVPHIVYLLSATFTRPVLFAMIIAGPLSWYVMSRWLDSFAYHVEIHWSIFLVAFAVSMLIAWLTVSYESIKAAIANPAKSLRDE